LWAREPGKTAWEVACEAPCQRDLALDDEYRISGSGLRSSDEFRLAASAGDVVELRVRPSSESMWELGVIVAGAGILVDLGALYALIVSFAVKLGDCTSNSALVSLVAQGVCRGEPTPNTLRAMALIALVPGTLAAVLGISTASANWSTRFTQVEFAVPPTAEEPPALRDPVESPVSFSFPFLVRSF
jgi:hypothetical protein